MGRINLGRLVLAGLVAGFIMNLIGNIAFGILLSGPSTAAGFEVTEGRQVGMLWIVGFAIGLALAWVYVAIRPRYGPGPGTAVRAGLLVWVVSAAPFIEDAIFRIVPTSYVLSAAPVNLIQIVLGALAAGYLYREGEAPVPS